MYIRQYFSSLCTSEGLLGPGADPAFYPLTDPKIRKRVLVAHLVQSVQRRSEQFIGKPLGKLLFHGWIKDAPGSDRFEASGLSKHIVTDFLGDDALTIEIDPRKLIRIVDTRPSSLAFIWDGDWDLCRGDLRVGSRYLFISDLDKHRTDLTKTQRYQDLISCIESGNPWASHQLGVFLDTPEKILNYLQVYLDFLDDMAVHGFNAGRGKDPLGVAISREGKILKVNKGLHRLAMAQHLGLPSVPVQVCHIHRDWWNKITAGTTGEEALLKMQKALSSCVPEESPSPLDDIS